MPQDSCSGGTNIVESTSALPAIPLFHTGPDFPIETALAYGERGYDLLERATAGIPRSAVRIGDVLSRTWLKRARHPYAREIDEVARLVLRPGTHFFNVHYEWGCTTAAKPVGGDQGTRLVRVLDWRTAGLGRHVVAARVSCPLGPWVTLTWPGYTGVLQAMAKGRFAAGLNQAPARTPTGWSVLDWLQARRRVWRSSALTPAHLLRQVFETAASFAEARQRLTVTALTAPVIYTLAGPRPGEGCVIERLETEARVIEGPDVAQCTNHWQTAEWQTTPHRPGLWSSERLAAMRELERVPSFGRPFDWLVPPILNDESRVATVADPAEGRIVAQGFEAGAPVTKVLDVTL